MFWLLLEFTIKSACLNGERSASLLDLKAVLTSQREKIRLNLFCNVVDFGFFNYNAVMHPQVDSAKPLAIAQLSMYRSSAEK